MRQRHMRAIPAHGRRATIRLMLADDHRMLREGLRRSMTDEGFDVVGEARDGEEAVRLAERAPARRHPDGRHHARDGRRRGHPPDPAGTARRHASSCSRCTPTRRSWPSAIRAGRQRLPGEGLLDRGDRRRPCAWRRAARPPCRPSSPPRCSTRSAGSTSPDGRGGPGHHQARGRGPAAHRRRLLDPRGGRASCTSARRR